jgi:ABC-type branched-subunit amino acid transport system substrate-binding protein
MARRGSRHLGFGLAVATIAVALVGFTAAPAAARPTGPEVKVMVIYEKSAGVANPELPEGAQAAAKALNKKDGIGGSPVRVLVCDTNNDPNTAAECGRQAQSEGVIALVGVLTPHSSSFMSLMAENKIPSIGVVLAGVADFQSPASFPITGGIVATSGDLPRFLYDDGARVISVVRPDLAAGAALKLFGDTALSKVGTSMKNDIPVPTDAPDMSSYVQAALAGGTDGIIVALPGQQAINFVQAARQADPDVKLALISTEPGPVREALGEGAAGIIQGPAFLPPTSIVTKEGARFLKELKAGGYKDSTGFRLNSWLSMQVLAKVAEGLPSPITSAAVFDKLNATSGLETGLTPPLQWTTPADVGVPIVTRVFNNCELAVKMTRTRAVKPVTGKFFDAFTGADCPTPSRTTRS